MSPEHSIRKSIIGVPYGIDCKTANIVEQANFKDLYLKKHRHYTNNAKEPDDGSGSGPISDIADEKGNSANHKSDSQ